jgi:spermidine synthase
MAIVHDTVADTMLLIDLDELYVVMSDSQAEKEFNREVVEKARGDVLLLGFGLGFILIPIMNNPKVTSITIVEIEPEVIELVASQIILNDKVQIVMGDALLYVPDKQYDIIYFDPDIPSERITELETQHINTEPVSHFTPYLKPNGEVICWSDDGRYRN